MIFNIEKECLHYIMIFYISFIINILELYISINDLQCLFIEKDKQIIKEILNFIVIFKYACYVLLKIIIIKFNYYFLLFYTILVIPHIPFLLFVLKHFYIIKKTLE